ncbi:T9SS type A sorting domain-containing protein [Flavobacterium sp.]|jgi:predicted small secreted protein|uniref:T9SS type A sorting domain-containing protein n=1 Tax=Flavobacterium sp. TaxID=239 RepID=UPI0037C1097A
MKNKLLFISLLFMSFFAIGQTSEKEQAARNWIKENYKDFKFNSDEELKLRFVRKGLSGETLRFQQMINGVPVLDTEILINFSLKGEVSFTTFNVNKTVNNINTIPKITSEDAIKISNNEIKVAGMITFQEDKLYVVAKNNNTKLAYRIVTNFEEKSGSWEVFVDANTGEVMSVKDIAIYCGAESTPTHEHSKQDNTNKPYFFMKKEAVQTEAIQTFATGTGYVFSSDPLSAAAVSYGVAYVDGNDATNPSLDAARVLVNFPEIENASGTYKLKSSYVEIKNLENPNKGLFTQTNADFQFNRNQDGFEAVNVFYHTDNSLRYINETLGVNCLPLTNSGVLWFDPSGVNGSDNSYYTNGTLTFGEGCVDDGEDGDVIWHELGHGLHDWLSGGSLSQVNGLSEGCGDYWAQSQSRALNQWNSDQPEYHWMFNWDGHNVCWGGRTTNYNSLYPGGLINQIHTDGQIWATTLMRIWNSIGKAKTDKAFLEGLALTTATTNQQNAAIAVRQAAINMNYSCADIKVFTDQFTATGYIMPILPLRVNCPQNQTVTADAAGNYTLPSFASLTNSINSNCTAVVTQSPAIGSVVGVGTHAITMTATSGGSVNCTFNLVVQTNLGVEDIVKNSFIVYPNPANKAITIKGDNIENEEVELYNMIGQKVLHRSLIANESVIDISGLTNGVYLLYFVKSKTSQKIIKQ